MTPNTRYKLYQFITINISHPDHYIKSNILILCIWLAFPFEYKIPDLITISYFIICIGSPLPRTQQARCVTRIEFLVSLLISTESVRQLSTGISYRQSRMLGILVATLSREMGLPLSSKMVDKGLIVSLCCQICILNEFICKIICASNFLLLLFS